MASTVVCLSLSALVHQASGHTLLMSRGVAVVHEDRVSIELEVAAEDFLHWYGLTPDEEGRFALDALRNAAQRHASALQRILVARNADGTRLAVEPFRTHLEWPGDAAIELHDLRKLHVKYTSDYAWSIPSRFLTLQLMMDGSDVGVLWQLVLAIHGSEADRGEVRRLTSRGNAETVELSWKEGKAVVLTDTTPPTASACTTCDNRGVTRLKEICADIEIGDDAVEARLSIPFPLLNTWMTLPSDDGEFLDADGQVLVSGRVQALVEQALSLDIDGKDVAAEVVELRFLSLDGSLEKSSASKAPVSLWTGRLLVHLRFRVEGRPERAKLRWNLFNSAVISAQAAIRSNGGCTEHEFSTYQPVHEWQDGS